MPFMPIDAAEACFTRSRLLLMSMIGDDTMDFVKDDMCRAALVMAVSALDSYMHWRVYQQISEVRATKSVPGSYSKILVPITELTTLANAMVANRSKIRPWAKVKNTIQKKLLTETFQSFDQVSNAMSLAGITEGWKKVSAELGVTSPEIKKRLNQIVIRRNHIVHEGDIMRKSKPRKVELNKITLDQTISDIDWLNELINAINKV